MVPLEAARGINEGVPREKAGGPSEALMRASLLPRKRVLSRWLFSARTKTLVRHDKLLEFISRNPSYTHPTSMCREAAWAQLNEEKNSFTRAMSVVCCNRGIIQI